MTAIGLAGDEDDTASVILIVEEDDRGVVVEGPTTWKRLTRAAAREDVR